MKNKLYLAFCIAAFTSCADSSFEDVQLDHNGRETMSNCKGHIVKYDDVLMLNNAQNSSTRSASETASTIECLTDESNDTLLFVNQKLGGGWTMYSSDTRVPAIVAHSESGTFDDLMQIEGAQLWVRSMIKDMALIKTLSDEDINFSEEEIAENKSFWESISSSSQYLKDNLLPEADAAPSSLTLISGHYELVSSKSYSEAYDSIAGLITVDWHQGTYYNYYCPLKSDNINHAPAGCVAIAGAQMLYFLHGHYGVSVTAPSQAFCDGNIDSYTWSQYNYTSSVWDHMATYEILAAPLIADVGRRLGMIYGDTLSSANPYNLVDSVFAPYGISSIYTDYDDDLLKNSLLDSIPVLLSAYAASVTNNANEKKGHAFIADRYKLTRIVTKNYYEWVYDSRPSDKPVPMGPTKTEYIYSSPAMSMIGFNWGWGSDYNNPDEWFSLTGDWILKSSSGHSYNWNITRKMIYNFQVINN